MLDRPIVGFPSIAAALGVSTRQVLQWATRKRDPLRLVSYQGVPRILASRLASWNDRRWEKPRLETVRGWQAISLRVEMSRMATIRAASLAEDPIPVHHPGHGRMVWAHASALDDWRDAHCLPYAAHRKLRPPRTKGRAGPSEPPGTGAALAD